MFQKKKVTTSDDNYDNDQHKKLWEQFLQVTYKVVDPILYSMFYESLFVSFDGQKNVVHIRILKKFMIFHDLFAEYKLTYQLLLERCFHAKVILFVDFYQEEEQKKPSLEIVKPILSDATKPVLSEQVKKVISGKLDISDKEKWELTHTLLKHFGGTVSEMGKDAHEPDA